MGDFNETLFACEHFSRAARSETHMRAFREVVDEISFQDLGWSGTAFTWDTHQAGDAKVKARLESFRERGTLAAFSSHTG